MLDTYRDSAANARNATINSSLHIALVGYRSHPHVGGQGIYIRHLAMALTRLGHQVDVISGPPYPELPSSIKLIKLPSLNLYETHNHITALRPKHLRSFSDTYEWWSMLTGGFAEPYTFGRRLAKYLKKQRCSYDIVHDNQTLCYSLLDLDRPVLATVHHPITRDREQALATAKNWLHRWGARRWYSFLRMQEKVVQTLPHIVTVSNSSREDIHACFGRGKAQTDIIFNGIDTELFRPLKDPQKATQLLLTACSSDQPVKGFAILLRAYKTLLATNPTLSLKVIGHLKPKGANIKLLMQLELEQKVEFVSGLSDAEMVAAYNQATLYVCPSMYEGFGLPVAEAMSCGTAVVSSDGGALPEVIANCGLLTPAGDSAALANAIQCLLNDPQQRQALERQGRKRAESIFCWQRVAEEYEYLYRRAITHHHANQHQTNQQQTN